MTVIVVGAGMAGLSAARRLTDNNESVVVVEARDRIGGRLHTINLGPETVDPVTVDLGGAWIHGPIGNPVTELAEQAGVTGHQSVWNDDPARSMVLSLDDQPTDPASFARGVRHFWQELDEWADLARDGLVSPDDDRSVHDLVTTEVISDGVLEDGEQLGFGFAAFVGAQNMEAEDVDRVSAAGSIFDDRPGGDLLLTGGGYGRIVHHLAAGLDVRLQTAVTQIRRNASRWVVATGSEELVADHVIVTVPVAVLQANAIEFDPPLPVDVVERLSRFGVGDAEKCAVRFADWPWTPGVENLSVVGAAPDDPFCSWNLFTENPIAVSYAGGTRARAMARLSDEQVLAAATERLRRAFGPLPPIVDWARTSWADDPYSRGAYTYAASSQADADRTALRSPITDGLWLASAAFADHYATADGAFTCGRIAADSILGLR